MFLERVKIVNNTDYPFDIDLIGTKIYYQKKKYIVIPNLGLKIDKIIIGDKEYHEFKYCYWSELVILHFDDEYVFKTFSQRHIDHSDKLKIDECKANYIKQEYFPINMIGTNPNILYYNVKCDKSETGMPLYNNNKLFGIVMRNNRENVYILPIIYVLKSISKSDCNIYMFETDDIKQIGRYKIYENMIFSPEFNYYIKLDAYLNLYYEKSNTNLNKIKFKKVKEYENRNSHILHYCKYFDNDMLLKIIENQDKCIKKMDIIINGMKKLYVYD